MGKFLISSGHTNYGNKGCGAVGFINESTENRILAKKVVTWLKKAGHEVDYHEVNEGSDYLKQQVATANKKNYDLVMQIHFNANTKTTSSMGTETLYSSNRGKPWAEKVTNKLGQVYKQRGAKLRDNLYWLNNTKAPAILIETCFVDSNADTDTYMINKDLTAKLIAEAINGSSISENDNTPNVDNKVNIKVDGKQYEFEAMIKDNSTYVKLRSFEQAGYKIDYINGVATIDKP